MGTQKEERLFHQFSAWNRIWFDKYSFQEFLSVISQYKTKITKMKHIKIQVF